MINLEQAAQEYADKKAKVFVSDTLIENTINDLNLFAKTDFKAGVEFAQQWISVKDKLPEVGMWIDLYNSETNIKENMYGQLYILNKTYLKDMRGFTHWRPINLK